MKLEISKSDVWAAGIKDQPGGLAEKLEALSAAGANLDFLIARRDGKGAGVVFVSGLKGTKQLNAAKKAGFKKSKSLQGLSVAAADKAGLGTAVTTALAEKGINLRGFSGAAIGKKAVLNLAFDKAADVTKAVRCLKAL